MDERIVEFVDCIRYKVEVIKVYRGCVGISFVYLFSLRDIVVDMCGNILVVVVNDNVIYFLD